MQTMGRNPLLDVARNVVGIFMATMILAPAIAAEPSPSGNSGSIGFFAALDQKLIEAKIVPRDAKEVVIQITNKTDRPLAIQRPDAFVAAAILAQNFGQNNNFPNNRNATNSNKVPQTLPDAMS